MTSRRPARRTLFALAGLLFFVAAAWRDRDLLQLRGQPFAVHDVDAPAPHAIAGLDALLTAEREVSAAREAFVRAVETVGTHPARWLAYDAAYATAAPEYRAALERFAARALAARALEPDNGIYEVQAGLALVDAAIWPHLPETVLTVERLKRPRADGERPFEVRDPATLRRGLDLLRAGLERPRLSYGERAALEGALAAAGPPDGTPARLERRLRATLVYPLPDLLNLRAGANALALIAARWRATGAGEPFEPLALGRRLALRLGSEADALLMVMIAEAMQHVNLGAWQDEAVWRGDLALARAAREEDRRLIQAHDEGRELAVATDRLGSLDRLVMPYGGWTDPGYDASLARRVDRAFAESVTIWALLGTALCGLVGAAVGVWLGARGPATSSATRGWTVGDLLAVVLPSFGLAAVLSLALARLHPSRVFGLTSSFSAVATFGLQALAAIAFALGAHRLLRRGAILRQHGLGWRRPARVRLAWGCLLGGLLLATGWVGPEATLLALPALVLLGAGLVLALASAGLDAAPDELRPALAAYDHRVALACFGAALALLGALELTVGAPRRTALLRAADEQALSMVSRETEVWGKGELQRLMRAQLETAPDRPGQDRK